MRPKTKDSQGMLFTSKLEQIIDTEHSLCKLASVIEWDQFDKAFGKLYDSGFWKTSEKYSSYGWYSLSQVHL